MADNAWLVGGIVLVLVGVAPFLANQFGSASIFAVYALIGLAFIALHFTRKSHKEAI